MFFLCDNCQIFFTHKLINCPYCGGRIYTKNISKESLLQNGYSLENMREYNNSNSIDNYNIIDSLRKSYNEEHMSHNLHSQCHDVIENITNQINAQPKIQYQNQSSSSDGNNNDFFSRFQSAEMDECIPTITNTSSSSSKKVENKSELQNRINNNYLHINLIDFFNNISLKTIFILFLIVCGVICFITIWKMRYIILNSLINFLVSLIIIIIFIKFLIYLIKSLFKL